MLQWLCYVRWPQTETCLCFVMLLGSFYHSLYLNCEVVLAAGSNEVIKEEKMSERVFQQVTSATVQALIICSALGLACWEL